MILGILLSILGGVGFMWITSEKRDIDFLLGSNHESVKPSGIFLILFISIILSLGVILLGVS